MLDEQQFEQLILQYEQLKNGSLEIQRLIEKEDYHSAITMIKNRESTFLNCKCMRRFLELTEEQSQKLENVLDDVLEVVWEWDVWIAWEVLLIVDVLLSPDHAVGDREVVRREVHEGLVAGRHEHPHHEPRKRRHDLHD